MRVIFVVAGTENLEKFKFNYFNTTFKIEASHYLCSHTHLNEKRKKKKLLHPLVNIYVTINSYRNFTRETMHLLISDTGKQYQS